MFTPCVDNVPVAERMPKNQKIQASVPVIHNGRFWKYLSKKYVRQISILGSKQEKTEKVKANLLHQLLKLTYYLKVS